MAATLAIAALLLVLLALPDFVVGHRPGISLLVVLSLCLAGLMIAALPLALIQRAGPVRAGLWIPVAAYVALLALEPLLLREPLPVGSTPWLFGLSLIAFGCTALAEESPVRAIAICLCINAALWCVYAGRLPVSHSLVDFVGLGVLAGALVAGVRAIRLRADQADTAEHHAQQLFEEHQRRSATEAERAHTDSLLHDNVLAALLAAAGNHPPERSADMARSALLVFSDMGAFPDLPSTTISFGCAVSRTEREFAPLRKLAQIDLVEAYDVNLPVDVADALITATLQALINSISHAGTPAHRTVAAAPLGGDGIRITISDDGAGFDMNEIAQERLGVRVSIVERMRLIGASARIDSVPGKGTVICLEWCPPSDPLPVSNRTGETLLNLIPRRQLYRILGVVIVIAILIATAEAFFVTHAYGSVIASFLGLAVLPALLRGARLGTMSAQAAWGIAGVASLLCCVATIGLDAATFDCVSVARYTCGVLAGAVMVWMAGHKGPPIVAVTVLVVQITLWAGPTGAIRLGLAAEIVIVIAGLLVRRAVREVAAAAIVAGKKHRELAAKQAEVEAFRFERQQRLHNASRTSAPMLRRIISQRGILDNDCRGECRVIEQALRDEIRGRNLLNDSIREVVATHRRRGAVVQLLDDGGLEGIAPYALDALLDDVARRLEPLRSCRIIVRTGHQDTDTAVTIVAATPDETAAALGRDSDDEVDLWVTIPRPITLSRSAKVQAEMSSSHSVPLGETI